MLKLKYQTALLLTLATLATLFTFAPAPALAQAACNGAVAWTGIVPDCLAAGANYRIMFITRGGRDARSTNIADYNSFVQGQANGANSNPFSGFTFNALGSTDAVDARVNTMTTGTGVPIFYYLGRRVADNYNDLYDGSWDTTDSRDQNGAAFTGVDRVGVASRGGAFTGTNNNGTATDRPLGFGGSVHTGRPGVSGEHFRSTIGAGSGSHSIYALSEVIRKPATGGVNICDRTQEVRDAILATSVDSFCTAVTDLATITRLDLTNMGINALTRGDFAGMTGLTELLLDQNSLTTLPDDIFDGLTSLRLLRFNQNRLETLPVGIFADLSALEELNLFSNALNTLPVGVFTGLTSVQNLFINSNALPSLPAGIFNGLTALANLALANNPFTPGTGLPAGIFDNVLDTLGPVELSGGTGLAVDADGRAAHFVCSRADFAAIVAATPPPTLPAMPHCLRITDAQLNTYLTDATLSGLTLSAGDLDPAFASATTTYTVNVANSVTSVTVTPTATITDATITVNGGNAATAIDLLTAGTAVPIAIVVTATDSTTMMTYTVDVTRAVPPPPAGTLTGTLTEASLFASPAPIVTITLANTEYALAGTLQQSHFTPADTIAGTVSISGFTRASNTVAMLTLAYTGEDITAPGTLSVTLAAAGHTATGDLTLGPIDITASAGANICDRTEQVRDAIVATSAANTDCTNINNLATITELDLEGTSIATLQSGDFAGMTGLTTLSLRRNTLTTLPGDIFAGLTALQTLNLIDNTLNQLDADLFDGLTALQTLNLNTNTLSQLDADLFDGLTALQTLNLSSNRLNQLDADLFDGLTALQTLQLLDNRLPSLDADIFDGLGALMILGLNSNLFTADTGLPAGVFDDVLDTLGAIGTAFTVDQTVRDAHFVCSRPDFAAIVAATATVEDCIRISSAEFDAAIPLVDATLSGLTLSDGALDPAFDSATTTYTVDVANSIGSVTVTPTATQSRATITVNGGSAATAIDLPMEGTAVPITIVVTAADTTTMMTYTVDVTRSASTTPAGTLTGTLTEASLFALPAPTVTITLVNTEYALTGTLLQGHFTVADTVAGTVSVSGFTRASNTVAMLTLTHTGEDITASGTLSVTLAAAGHTATDALATNTIPITASTGMNICGRTAQVRDAIIAGSAATECTSVTAAHLVSITTLDLTNQNIATLQSGDFAGMTGLTTLNLRQNTLTTLPADLFNGLTALQTLNLHANTINALDADLFDGLTALIILSLNNNQLTTLPAGLFDGLDAFANLDLTTNPFTPGTGLPAGIFDDVLNTLVALTVDTPVREAHFVCSRDDADAIVAATSGVTDCIRISSAELTTAIPLVDATLSGLTLSPGTLDPAFDSAITTYTVDVANSIGSVTVTPTATQSRATITVNGGSAADAIDLRTAGTAVPIAIVVTAADTTTMMTYTVDVTRSASTTPAGTLTGTLTEASLFALPAPTVTITLVNTEYERTGTLRQSHFTVADTVAGTVSVSGITRDSSTVVEVTLTHTGEDITAPGTLSVTLADAGHTGAGNLTTDTIPITASAGMNICDRTPAVRDEIVRQSSAGECTSVGDLASITGLLFIGENLLASLQRGDFAGLTGLTSLNLGGSGISTLPADIFAGLSSLTTLDLSANSFTELPANIFAGLSSLETLELHSSLLRELDADIFDGLSSLRTLSLQGNTQFRAGTGLPAGIFDDVLDTLEAINPSGGSLVGFFIDDRVRNAHFVCPRDDADPIVAATAGVDDCLRISSAELTTAIPLVDATLSGLTLSTGTLDPAFDSATTTYTVSLPNNVGNLTVMPTATNAGAGATITVRGNTVASGANSALLLLRAGIPLEIPVVVTAADTTTTMTYTVTATRADVATVSGVAFTSTGPYALGEAIQVTVTFSDTVTVTDTPEIALDVGANTRTAAFTSGSGSANLIFAYTVVAGETDADGVSIGANALTTPGSSTIQNAAGNDADLTHDAVAANIAHAVDTAAPTLTGATVNGSSLVLTYNEDLDASSTPANDAYTIAVSDGMVPMVTGTTISGAMATLTLNPAVTRGVTVTVSYTPGSAPLQDTAGNDAAGLTTTSVTNDTPEPFGMIYTDDVIPDALNVGDRFSVDFDINHPEESGSGVRWSQTTNDCGIAHSIDGEGVLTFTPLVAQAESTCNFVVRFEDTTDRTVDTFEFTVSINAAAPVAPVASDGSRTVTEGDSIAVNLGVTGTSPVTCATSSPLPGGLTLNGAACTITGDVAVDAITNGTLSQVFVITWTATNTAGADTGTYTLTVNALNSAPMFSGVGVSAQIYAVGTSIVPVNLPPATGGDGDLSYTITPLPSGLRLNVTPTGNTLTGTPAAGTEQTATTYTYTVSDSDVDTAPTDTASLTFTITIVPAVGVTVTPTALTVPENGGTDSYTVVLNSAPTADVVIAVAGATAATVSTDSLTFTTTNWDTAQTVTVTGVNDSVDNPGDRRTATVTHAPTSADAVYNTVNIASVTVTVTDDDALPTVPSIANPTWPIDLPIVPLTLPMADPATGTPSYALTGTLPAGLTYDASSRTISGTPTAAGVARLTYSVTDTVGTTRIVFTVTIGSPVEELTEQLNEQILPQVFLKLADVGSRLIADRLSAGAIVGGGTISSQASGGEAGSSGLMAQLGQWLSGDAAEVELSRRLQNLDDVELRDFIDDLSFAAAGEQVGMAGGSLYGIGNYTRLSGDEDGLDWDGDLYSGYVGLDKRLRNGALAGVLLAYSKGEFEYVDTVGGKGEYDLDISSVNPYVGWSLSEDLDIWASVGYGVGEVELNDGDGPRSSDLEVGSVSVGASGRLVVSDELIAGGRSELHLRGDGSASQVDFDRSDAGFTDVSSHRLRLIVEASHLRSGASGSVRSGLELGVRHDGGDGQDDQGLELGGSLEWSNTRGLTLSGRTRVLTLADYDEWGVSGILRLAPGQGGRGLSFSLSPGYGRDDSGTEQLWQRGVSAVSSAQTARLRMDGEVGYGMWLLGGTVQPYLGASLLQGGDSRQRMGMRLEFGRGVQLELEGSRAAAEHRIELQWQWNW